MVSLRRSAGSSRDLTDAGLGLANVDTAARTAQGGCPFTVASSRPRVRKVLQDAPRSDNCFLYRRKRSGSHVGKQAGPLVSVDRRRRVFPRPKTDSVLKEGLHRRTLGLWMVFTENSAMTHTSAPRKPPSANDKFLQHADECERLAATCLSVSGRYILLDIARQWRKAAKRASPPAPGWRPIQKPFPRFIR